MTSDAAILSKTASLRERLERGELVYFPVCPFSLPAEEDAAFLCAQRVRGLSHREISFDPLEGKLRGQRLRSAVQAERLSLLLRSFSETATNWLANQLPDYCDAWAPIRATLRTEDEAIRSLRHGARNDLLHIDNFPSRPSGGRRLLRLFVNINQTEERVWVTSGKFADLLRHYQSGNRVPSLSVEEWQRPLSGVQRLLQRDWSGRPAYDAFMLRLQQSLRADDNFQERASKQFWRFPPGSAWLLFADGLSHAVLRGQFALEHSYFVPQNALICPDLAPLQQLVAAEAKAIWRRAG